MSDHAGPEVVRESVPLTELDAAKLQISISPLRTVFVFAMGAIATRGDSLGTGPPEWKRAVRAQFRQRDLDTLAPLGDPRTAIWPNILIGTPCPGVTAVEDELELMVSADLDRFVAEVEEEGWAPPSWSPVRRNPGGWLRDYAEALRRAWVGVEPLWERSRGLLDREVERVGAAVARGAVGQCVDALYPRSSIVDDGWRVQIPGSRSPSHAADEILVSPLVVEDACFITDEDDDECTLNGFSYPLPGAWRALADDLPPPASLEALLGAQRARILISLDRPATAGEVAQTMYATPGGATFQLRTLESAGLITRRRQGRHVAVERTERGSALIALYADP